MDTKHKEEIIDDICNYAENHHIKEMLHEYLKRVILNKPENVYDFLVSTIEKDPFVVSPEVIEGAKLEEAAASVEE